MIILNTLKTETSERETEKEERTWGWSSKRHCIKGVGEAEIFPAWEVPRQCPLVLLIVISLREGKLLEVKKVKVGMRSLS
jgi:hypothetical protein